MNNLRTMFRTADDLVHVTKLANEARRRAVSKDATWRELLRYEALAEKQQLLAHKVYSLHALANGKAFR